MKPAGILLGLAFAGVLSAAPLERGDSLREVHQALGQPRGQVHRGEQHVLYYERGEVELREGAVVRVAMLSPEEYSARLTLEQRRSEERENRRQQRIEEGESLRDRKLADTSFAKAPLAYQVAYWEDFARRYPGVSVAEPLAIARLSLQEKIAEQNKRDEADARLAELELRLLEAERAPRYYAIGGFGYPRRHEHHPFTLGPFDYTFFSAPLPPYSTPSGNPAGELRGPLVTTPSGNPAGEWRGATSAPFPTRRGDVRAVDDRRDRRGEERRWSRDDGPRGRVDAM